MVKWLMRYLIVFSIGALALAATACMEQNEQQRPEPDRVAGEEFASERLLSEPGPPQNDWEPSVAADDDGNVYIATTRFGGPKACSDCPDPAIVLKRSDDGGQTWSDPLYVCRCPGVAEQADPVLTVDERGRVFATWMNDFAVYFSRSDDGGRSWTEPVAVDGDLRWSDKPWIATSGDGEDAYITFNGPGDSPGAPYTVSSDDAGETWSDPVDGVQTNELYWFAGGLTVTPEGTVIGSHDVYEQDYKGRTFLRVLRSEDGGRTWDEVGIGTSEEVRRCPKGKGCEIGFLGPQISVASDAAGRVYAIWNQANLEGGTTRVYVRWSDDEGETWSPAQRVSSSDEDRVDSEFPMIAATGDGDVRVAWMDNRTGRWNTWYRRSTDGGRTWSDDRRLSDRPDGAPYKSPEGFEFPYGDYGQMTIGGDGTTHATWGEGPSYSGPGGTWFTRSG